jgi:multiple sugar transport system substrate-binding protein
MMFSWSGQSGFEQVLNRFRKLHPAIHINEVWLSWTNYWPKLLTGLIAGDPPDVFDIEQGNLVQFASKGLLLPLDAYMKRDSVKASDFYTASLQEGQWNGKTLGTGPGTQYALPWDYQVGVWFYNKTMFEQAGVSLPKPGWTWADVRADALKLTKRDASGNITQYGTIAPNNPNADLWLLTKALGGSYFSSNLNKVTLGGGFAKAMKFSHDLI